MTVAEFLERKARRSEATRVTYGKAEAAFARCFGVKSADILVERMKARELDPYSALDKFVSCLLANTAAPKTVLTYVTAIKGLLCYEGISLDSYQLRAKVELPQRRNVTTGQVLAAEEHMHRRQEEERKRRLLDFIPEVMRIILNEYLSSRPTDAKQCRHRVACKGLHSLDGQRIVRIIVPAEHIHDGKTIYICTVCGLGYDDILIAYACEEYFRQYGESSTDIVKKAIYRSDTADPLLKRAVAK